jgi:ferric-dicitrate binding protein FerR (iron transport regulator)
VFKKFLRYTVEEMLEDRDFPVWLKHLSDNQELSRLVDDNPQFAYKVRQAKEIIMILNVKEEPVFKDEIYAMLAKISEVDVDHQSQLRTRRIRGYFKYAAAVVFVLMLSALGYWELNKETVFQWASNEAPTAIKQSRLILSTGEEIDLKKDESVIKVSAQQNSIRINNDSIVALSAVGAKRFEIAMNQVVVPFGKKSLVELSDGTKVWLNAGSKMAFPARFSGSKREVFLEGEACFDVTHDKSNPFFVNTREVIIRVLGTKFNVSDYEADKEITTVLLEGSVSLRENKGINFFGEEVILKRHQRALFSKAGLSTKVYEEANPEIFTAWTEGWFTFYKEPLGNILKKVERYYNVQVVGTNLFQSDDLISGKLDLKDSIEDVMKVLADVAKVTYRIDHQKIFIVINNEMPMRN